MPRQTLRTLVGRSRTRRANRQLGLLLAFVAGAVNAGGFLAVQRYTSHMTGVVSGVADDLALGLLGSALAGLTLVAVFVAGAMTTALLTNWARVRQLQSEYALSLLLEAALLLLFGLLGAVLAHYTALLVPAGRRVTGRVLAKQAAVLCGQPWFDACVRALDPGAAITWHVAEGATVTPGTEVCRIEADARALLSAERPALNVLQTRSAGATVTRRYVEAIAGLSPNPRG
jgi:hypothetical protein